MKMQRFFLVALLVLPGGFSSACLVTAKQGKKMQKRITMLEEQVRESRSYHEILMQSQEDIKKLQEVINRAAKNLGENSADFALQIDQLRTDLAELEGRLAELAFHFDKLAENVEENKKEHDQAMHKLQRLLGSDKPLEPSKIPDDRKTHWKKAVEAMESKDYELARGLFREYEKKYPDDPRADDAQLNVGIVYLDEKRAAKALGELQKVIDKYPDSDKMDGVLYHMGVAFFMIQNCADARTLFKSVIAQFPKSPYKKKSKEKIHEILKAPKSVCPTIK